MTAQPDSRSPPRPFACLRPWNASNARARRATGGGEYWEHEPCRGCDRWWKLHGKLHRELGCKPWQWPCIEHPDTVSGYPEGSEAYKRWKPDLEAQDCWRALDEAAKEARRAKREARRAVRAQEATT